MGTSKSCRRRLYESWGASFGLHLVVICFAAVMWLPVELPPTSQLQSRWADDDDPEVEINCPAEPLPAETEWQETSLSNLSVMTELLQQLLDTSDSRTSNELAESIALPLTLTEAVAASESGFPFASLSQQLGNRTSGAVSNASTASGQFVPNGGGDSSGEGFFGVDFRLAQSIVFVVDNSKSMNHPHDSPAKTRFRRLKLELLRCLIEMEPHQSFHVIFFSNQKTEMPGQKLQPAIPAVRDPSLRWIANLPTGPGPTDPRSSLDVALKLRPDVICFLTDGDFHLGIQKQLLKIQQRQSAIHTFAIGNADAASTLSQIAEKNRGEYRFIP